MIVYNSRYDQLGIVAYMGRNTLIVRISEERVFIPLTDEWEVIGDYL